MSDQHELLSPLIATWNVVSDNDSLWNPAHAATPDERVARTAERARWGDAIDCASEWSPELSALEFRIPPDESREQRIDHPRIARRPPQREGCQSHDLERTLPRGSRNR